MARIYPDFNTLSKLRVPPTEGEYYILEQLSSNLTSEFEIFFNPYLDCDRPDIIILKKEHGVIIIEVKDWNLNYWKINKYNHWILTINDNLTKCRSPMQQAFHYKANIFNLHIPILGLKGIINNNFYKVISPYVYFHKSSKKEINNLYTSPLYILSNEINELNQKQKNSTHYKNENYQNYEIEYQTIKKQKEKLERDKNMSFGNDNLNQLINKIKKINPNKLFTDEIYKEFKRRLQPICYTFEQAIPIDYTPSQIKYFQSQDEQIKIKGIAGTGKTILLATRALSAYKKNKNVLILTFNITLKNYIRDKLSQINYLYHNNSIPLNQIEISNYHNFFLSQANNLNIELPYDVKDKKLYIDINIFQNQPTIKYSSIFIDEIQDYEKEWIYIIKNYFLEKNGEMVLFGDIAQNIYERVELLDENENKFNKIPLLNYNLYGFGKGWKTLIETKRKKSKKIFNLINDFTNNFIANKNKNQIPVDSPLKQQELFSDDHILIKDYDKNNLLFVANCIKAISKKLNLHPNDISIIASQKDILVNINEFFLNEKIQTTFAPIEVINKLQHKELIEKYERTLKVSFQMNSGCMKLSTIKSFKGLENLTVFYIHNENDKIEEIYTAITRAKKNLIIFINKKSKFYNYFLQHSSQ